MKRFDPVVITAKSGNEYNVFANGPESIRVTTRGFNPHKSATFNRVDYDLVADFTINRKKERPWEQYYLYLAKCKSFSMDASESATKKARKEVAEVAGVYVRVHREHLAEQVALGFDQDAASSEEDERKAENAVQAARMATDKAKFLADEWRGLCAE